MNEYQLGICLYFSHLAAYYWIPIQSILRISRTWLRLGLAFLIQAGITCLVLGDWSNLWIAVIASLGSVLHGLTWKKWNPQNPGPLVISEISWLGFTAVLTFILPARIPVWAVLRGEPFFGILVLLIGWTISAFPIGSVIGLLLRKYSKVESLGFPDGGRMIGLLERSIIYLLFLINAPVGVGFLITAKTLFRFGEITKTRDQKNIEYILIGTFLSFLFGMVIAVLALALADPFFPETVFKLLG